MYRHLRGFDSEEGDRVAVTALGLLDAEGRLDGSRVRLVGVEASLLLRADLDGDGAFEATLARLGGAGAGLTAEDVLVNAIA